MPVLYPLLNSLLAGPALAAAVPSDAELDFDSLEPVPAAELAAQRGGFTLEGMTIEFGAQMRTFLNGELALETVVHWTDSGITSSQTVAPWLTMVSAEQIQAGALSAGNIQIEMGESNVFLANMDQTAIIHRAGDPLGSVLINTANGIDARTEVFAELGISGFDAFRSALTEQVVSDALHQQVGAATGGAFGN